MQNRKNSDASTESDTPEQIRKRKTLSDMYDVVWPGYAPTQTPKPIKYEKNDYPFGTRRSYTYL